MEVTKPYEFIGFGAMNVTKPYEFIGFGAMVGESGPEWHLSSEGVARGLACVSSPVDPGADSGGFPRS